MAVPVGKAPHKKPFVFSRPGSEASKPVQTPHSAAADEAKHQGEKYNVYLKDKEYLTQIYQKFGIDKEPTTKDVQTWRDAMQNFSETHGHNIGDTIPAKSWANSWESSYFALEGTDAISSDKKMETMNLLKSAMYEIERQSNSERMNAPSPGDFSMMGSNSYHAVITKEMDDALAGKLINQPGVQSTAAQEAQRKGEEYAKWLEAQKDKNVEVPHTIAPEMTTSLNMDFEPPVTEPEPTPEPIVKPLPTKPFLAKPSSEPKMDVDSGDLHSVSGSAEHNTVHRIDEVSIHVGDEKARAEYAKNHSGYVPDGTARDSAHYEGQKYQQWLDSQKGPGAQTAQTQAAKNIESARWTPADTTFNTAHERRLEIAGHELLGPHGKRLEAPNNTPHSYAKEQAEHEGEKYQQWLNEQKGPGAETAKIEQLKARAAAKAKELGEPEPDADMLGTIRNQHDSVNIKNEISDASVSTVNDDVPVTVEPSTPAPIMPEPTPAPQVNHQSKLEMLEQSGMSQITANVMSAGKAVSINTPQAGA